jgi:exodeoxyribonuclease VII large subunit
MGYFEQRRTNLTHLRQRLVAVQGSQLDRKRQRAISFTAKLDAMSPLKVLTRGYAMTQTADGDLVRSVQQIHTGDQLKISLSDGVVSAAVTDIQEVP